MAYTTINKHTDYFNTKLYTGNATNPTTISGVGFQPDWVWTKLRSGGTEAHRLCDAVRGATYDLFSNATDGQATNTIGLKSFNSDGYVIGNNNGYNLNSGSFVSWNWKANGAGSANTDGSINTTSTSVNTTAGLSISTYTGTGSAATVGHGLGVVPKVFIIKKTSSGSSTWITYHHSLGIGYHLGLNNNNAQASNDATVFNSTAPTSSVVNIGTWGDINGNGSTYVMYAFAEKTGYSKFGSWVSNNNADGTFVYTGFAPSFVMLKEYDGTNQWVMYDNKRPGYNQTSNALFANANSSEATDLGVDLLSNGYKIRATNNQNTGNYIYMAFGQSLVGSNNVPCTAR